MAKYNQMSKSHKCKDKYIDVPKNGPFKTDDYRY